MKIQGLVVAISVTLTPCLYAESFTTNIVDGIETNAGPQLTLGATGPYNFLLVTNSGKLTNGITIVGDAAGADNNSAVVAGSNSVWRSTNDFLLGNTGSLNRVSVLNGGMLFVNWGITTFGSDHTSRSNVMLLTGPGSSFTSFSSLRIGLFGSDNGLIIREGARASIPNAGIIGREGTAHGNFALLEGAGSRWTLGDLTVGRAGSANYLHIFDGAELTAVTSRVGALDGARGNRVRVSGPGSLWTTQGELVVGSFGPNNIVDVTDGARVTSGAIAVGADSSSNQLNVLNAVVTDGFPSVTGMTIGVFSNANFNAVTFDGPNARGTNERTLVGSQGASNSLVILNGAEFTVGGTSAAPELVVGAGEYSDGNSVEVSGAGSKLIATVPFTLGNSGSGNRLLVDGARLQTVRAQIGTACQANNNAALIRGAGAVWTNGFLDLGFCSMSNSLTITDGAHVLAGRVTSSVQGGGRNTIEVSGAGSLLRAANLVVGLSGTADMLTITDGGVVAGRADRLGGSNNFALVRGAGSSWSNGSLEIGGAHRNALRVDEGASIQTDWFLMGTGVNSMLNSADIVGPGTWLSASTVGVGGASGRSNRLVVSAGASVSSQDIYLGSDPRIGSGAISHFNLLSVIGTNSLVITESNVVVGFEGRSNRLEVIDGGQIHSAGRGVIGERPGLRNSAIVSGPRSVWFMTNELVVGQRAYASSLVVSNGGFVRSQSGVLGTIGEGIGGGVGCSYAESASRVFVTGHNSLWAITDSLVVGSNAIGNSLLITNGGRVSARDVIIGMRDGGRTSCAPGLGTNALFLNEIEIAGGNLDLEFSPLHALEVRYGTLRLRSGSVTAGKLLMTNQWSRLELLGGTLFCSGALIDNRLPLIIGDGLHNASFFGNGDITAPRGIVVREHAMLEGGPIMANVTNFGTMSVFGFGTVVASNFVQQPAGNLLIDVGPPSRETLTVSNVAVLNGKLLIRQHFNVPSNTVAIVTAGAVNGTFSNVTNGGRLKTMDNLASFVVEYTATSVTLRDYQSTDLDGDMIEDAWATRHFGHSPLTPAEKAADADSDGASNYDEFIAGTDPTDSNSLLRASISYADGAASVTFPCQEGKRYYISWWTTDLLSWSSIFDPTFSFPMPGVCRWTDDGRLTNGLGGPARFFRVFQLE